MKMVPGQLHPFFCVSCDSESEDSRTPEELVVCTRPHGNCGNERGQDQTFEGSCHFFKKTPQKDGPLLYRC